MNGEPEPEDDFSHPEDNHPPDRIDFGLFNYAAAPADGPEAVSADDLGDGDVVRDPHGRGPFTVVGYPALGHVGVWVRLRDDAGRVRLDSYLETEQFIRLRHARHVDELWTGADTPAGSPILVGDVSSAMAAAQVFDIGWRFRDACTWCGSLTSHPLGICD